MISPYFIRGSSSLLLIISTIKAFYCSTLIAWKLSNIFLIFASFLCNASEYCVDFLVLDYFAIFLICTSYINNIYANTGFFSIVTYEYNKYKSIENTKNLAVVTAATKSLVYTYFYADNFHFILIVASSISGIIVYRVRLYFVEKNKKMGVLFLTYLFHICVMNVLYVTSVTAT